MPRILPLLLLNLMPVILLAQNASDFLLSGPMVGYSATREVMLWVQTNGSANVFFRYRTQDDTSIVFQTAATTTRAENAYTAHLGANLLKPGKTYEYQLVLNNQPVNLPYPTIFRTPAYWPSNEQPEDVKFAFGSCHYVDDPAYGEDGDPEGPAFDIFESIREKEPQMMIWLGDNNYLRAGEWSTRTGIIHRNTHTRAIKKLQPLLASVSHYAVWDDHDYGPNNSDRSFIGKEMALEAFTQFWANPSYGFEDLPGLTTQFSRADVDFFLLDDRYHRAPEHRKSGKRTILGEKQLEWLIDALSFSKATFKFVCIGGQVLNDAPYYENYSRIAPEERAYLLRTIAQEGIENVIFLTGDRHHAEFSKVVIEDVPIYDFTSSSLTATPYPAPNEPNGRRVEGSHYGKNNFGLVEISGDRDNRIARLSICDRKGKEVWSTTIEAQP